MPGSVSTVAYQAVVLFYLFTGEGKETHNQGGGGGRGQICLNQLLIEIHRAYLKKKVFNYI